jgi:hypothetical protein
MNLRSRDLKSVYDPRQEKLPDMEVEATEANA